MHVTTVAAVRSRAVHGRITKALVAVEVILSGVLCAWQIGRHSMWLDEAVTAGLAHAPTNDFLKQVTGREINSVLYFTLVRAFSTVAGHGEASLRALSALAVAATVVPVYLLGRDLASPRTGLTASLLWAVSPRAVQLGQEARGFALETFLLALSAVVLLRAFRTGRRAAWAWWSALTLLAGLCHLLSTFVSVSLLTPLLLAGIRARWRPALLAVTTALAPLAALAAVRRTRGAGHLSFLTGLPLRQVVGLPGNLSYDSVAVAALLCVACVAGLVGVGRHWAVASSPERAELLLPVVWLVLPVVGRLRLLARRPAGVHASLPGDRAAGVHTAGVAGPAGARVATGADRRRRGGRVTRGGPTRVVGARRPGMASRGGIGVGARATGRRCRDRAFL